MTIPESLRSLLEARHEIPFVEFMQHALYSPDGGYYTTNRSQIGAHGDFITAPELTPLFGQTLALQCHPLLTQLSNPSLFEFGAGTGRLCVTILKQLETLHCLPENYFILEVSGQLRDCQQKLVQQHIPHLANRIQWLTQWPKDAFTGIVLANEVLDAMPVHRFLRDKHGIFESHISLDTNGKLIERFNPCTNQLLLDYVQQHVPSDYSPYLSEVNLLLNSWINQCHTMLNQGAMILIDYGFPRAEYYHPDRNQGTLMCHYQHTAHPNPLIHVGTQDITAHVDFTHVAEAADAAGFHVAGYTNQASFLLAAGLPELLETIHDERERINAVQAVKQLVQPHEMGELFKVMALTKQENNDGGSLKGFMLNDKRATL